MEPVEEGIWNLVGRCAEAKKGEQILVLNERGKIEEEIADKIAEAVRESGADCFTLWADSVPRERRSLT